MAYKRGWTRLKLICYLRKLRKKHEQPLPPDYGYSPMDSDPVVFYDPSDLTRLFQDTGGTTPVTAAGQTVRLMKGQGAGMPDIIFTGDVTFAGGAYLKFGTTGQGLTANFALNGQQITACAIVKEANVSKWQTAIEYGDTWNTAGSICINAPSDGNLDTYSGQVRGASGLRTRYRNGFLPIKANGVVATADHTQRSMILYVNTTSGDGTDSGLANFGARPASVSLPLKVAYKSAYPSAKFLGYIGPIALFDKIPAGDELDSLLGWGQKYTDGYENPGT